MRFCTLFMFVALGWNRGARVCVILAQDCLRNTVAHFLPTLNQNVYVFKKRNEKKRKRLIFFVLVNVYVVAYFLHLKCICICTHLKNVYLRRFTKAFVLLYDMLLQYSGFICDSVTHPLLNWCRKVYEVFIMYYVRIIVELRRKIFAFFISLSINIWAKSYVPVRMYVK